MDETQDQATTSTPAAAPVTTTSDQAAPDSRIKKLSDEAATWRNKLREAETESAQLKQQLAEQAGFAQKIERTAQIKASLILQAARLGFADPGDALQFVKLGELEARKDDELDAAITEAAQKVLETKPYLGRTVAQPPQPPGAGSSTANPAGGIPLSRTAIEQMSEAERQRRYPEIIKWLADGGK